MISINKKTSEMYIIHLQFEPSNFRVLEQNISDAKQSENHPLRKHTKKRHMIRRNNNIGEASTLLSQPRPANRTATKTTSTATSARASVAAPARGASNPRASQGAVTARSSSGSYTGGPTHQSYATKTMAPTGTATAAAAAAAPIRTGTANNNNNNNTSSSRNSTPVPNSRAPPQPTPRNSSQPRQQRTGGAASGLVYTPGQAAGRDSPVQQQQQRRSSNGPSYNYVTTSDSSSNNDISSLMHNKRMMQQQQQPQQVFVGSGAVAHMFSKRPPELAEFQTAEARDALRETLDTEKSLQTLVKARRDRALEVFEMLRDEAAEWQHRLDLTKRQLQNEEKKRLDLAAHARQIETDALNLRHKLRQVQQQRQQQQKKRAQLLGGVAASAGAAGTLGASGRSGSDTDAPHRIISSVLQKYNNLADDNSDSSGADDDDEYAAVLARDGGIVSDDDDYDDDGGVGVSPYNIGIGRGKGGGGLLLGDGGKKKKSNNNKRKLSKAERLLAAGKIAEQLEQSTRVTRLSVESRVAELEATLAEISSLQNQRIGFGATVEEMRNKVRDVQRTRQQATWLSSCLPLLDQTVRQREALAAQGDGYGKKVLANLMQLNKRDDETIVILQERAERNLLSTEQLIKMVQEENAHMSKELGEAVREAETWRASMQQTSERYQEQLRETEQAIDEASRQRRAATF